MLSDRGFDIAFGVPSLATLDIFRGLDGSGLRFVGARETAHAAFMADGYARASGAPAVCLAAHGPGLAALAAPAAQALADCVPMLILSSAQPTGPEGTPAGHRHTLSDSAAVMRSVCRASHRLESLEALPPLLDEIATSLHRQCPGPVHLEIPGALLRADSGQLSATILAKPMSLPAMKEPPAAMIASIIMRLCEAERPVLILGGGAVGIGAENARLLAERLNGPVLMTSSARGLIPADHPLCLGGYLTSPTVKAVLTEADVVLAIGTALSPEEWGFEDSAQLALGDGALIRVDIEGERLYQNATPAIPLACDARALIDPLLEGLPRRDGATPDVAALRQKAAAAMPHALQRHREMIESIWQHLPEAVVIGDVCGPVEAALDCAMPPGPRRWLTGAAGFGAHGHALPAAIGAKIADPRRPVVALMGDSAVGGVIAALATAVDAGAHVVLLVWHNAGMGAVRDAMAANHIKPQGVDLGGVDLQPVARGLGAAFARVHGPDYFREALRSAIMRPGPTVLELREDYWFG